jgi:hypothetical protein
LNPGVGILQIDPPGARRFNLGAGQLDACLACFEEVIIMICLAIGRNDFLSLTLFHGFRGLFGERGELVSATRNPGPRDNPDGRG